MIVPYIIHQSRTALLENESETRENRLETKQRRCSAPNQVTREADGVDDWLCSDAVCDAPETNNALSH